MNVLEKEHDRWLEIEEDEVVGICENCDEVIYSSERYFDNDENEKVHEDCFVELMMKEFGFKLVN